MGNFNPLNPTKYRGTDKYITFFVTRNRAPTGADYRQPETGTLYSVGTIWQVGKGPSTGVEGDEWILTKIVANIAYWVKITSGVLPSGPLLSLSDTANTLVYPRIDNPVGNIQLKSTTGALSIVSDPANHEIDFNLPGGGHAIEAIQVQGVNAPGVNPVTPDDVTGIMIVNGELVAAQDLPIRSYTNALHEYAIQVQISSAVAASDITQNGFSHFDSQFFTIDPDGFVTLTAGNADLHTARYIVGDLTMGANYTTLQAAVTAAPESAIIYVQEGTYIEDIVFTKNVTIASLDFSRAGYELPNTILRGKFTVDGSDGVVFMNLTVETNGDYAVEMIGNGSFSLINCSVYGITHTPIHVVTPSLSNIFFYYSRVDIQTTGISLYDVTGGNVWFYYSILTDSGSSVTLPTCPAGAVEVVGCIVGAPLGVSGTSNINVIQSSISNLNIPCVTLSGTATMQCKNNTLASGTASTLVIGAGCNAIVTNNTVTSTNTNVFTGAGVINTAGNACTNSSGNNVSTINNLTVI